MDVTEHVTELLSNAVSASRALAKASTEAKNRALGLMADEIISQADALKTANAADLEAGRQADLSSALIDRLTLTDKRVRGMADGLRVVADLPDPVGEVIETTERPNGLVIERVRVPIGVIVIIYESRPNVTADAAGLCLKSGNAVILRGGKESLRSNLAIRDVLCDAVEQAGLDRSAIQLVETTDRAAVDHLLAAEGRVNLVIPRGGEGLIRAVVEKAKVPVIKHYKGVCHVFVDAEADLDMAEAIAMNAKCQRPGVCNAMETLLVHSNIAAEFLPRVVPLLREEAVDLRGCGRTRAIVPDLQPATDDDYYAEYLDLVLAIRVVDSVHEAVEHITTYGSAHTDAIVTEDAEAARRFVQEVDSSSVMVNASTRFSDGGEYGMGAEIGISTDKIHARGPMGLRELTSYKFVVRGHGQVRT
ncbi:MAG: glutamate-5-semialdehyde dehydrogenase [Planctomycetota bacterium]